MKITTLDLFTDLSNLECEAVVGGQGCAGPTRINKGKSTFPHRGVMTVPSQAQGICGVNMSCPEPTPEPDSGGGICGVNMSCPKPA